MTPIADLIAAELPRHVDLILFEDETRYEVTLRVDTGGLRCSCGEWQAPRDENGLRPRAAWHAHVAESIHRRITTPEAVDVLTAINERLILPRIGLSMFREMDKDITTLQAAAALLAIMLAPEVNRGE